MPHAVPRPGAAVCLLAGLSLTGLSARAQEAAGSSGFVPTFGAAGSYVETRNRLDDGNGREFVATLSPGFSFRSGSGLVRGSADYQAAISERRGVAASSGRDTRNSLAADLVADLVPERFSIGLTGGIAQQAVSAFGEQSVDGPIVNSRNVAEVRSVTVSPTLRGPVAGLANYGLRASANTTRSSDDQASNSRSGSVSFDLRSPNSSALVGWFVQASRQSIDYEAQEPVDNASASLGLSAAPSADLRLSVNAGRESVEQGSSGLPYRDRVLGIGMQWQPSMRTSLSVNVQDRYFGRGGSASFQHRMPRSIVSYVFSRDTTSSAAQITPGVTLFDLAFAASTAFPDDPNARSDAVRADLRNQGLDANQVVVPGFQTSSVSLQRRQDLSIVWFGLRTTLTVQGNTNTVSGITFRSDVEPLLQEPTRQHGYSASLVYRLTPQSSAQLGGSRRMTFANSTAAGNDLKSAFANWNYRLGRSATFATGLRYTVFNSATTPYRETTATASLNLRF